MEYPERTHGCMGEHANSMQEGAKVLSQGILANCRPFTLVHTMEWTIIVLCGYHTYWKLHTVCLLCMTDCVIRFWTAGDLRKFRSVFNYCKSTVLRLCFFFITIKASRSNHLMFHILVEKTQIQSCTEIKNLTLINCFVGSVDKVFAPGEQTWNTANRKDMDQGLNGQRNLGIQPWAIKPWQFKHRDRE